MRISKNIYRNGNKGQTVIETVLMLFFLLLLFFLIAEFARAWYLKNSLNNAARVGVRVAVVTPNLSDSGGPISCSSAVGPVYEAVCSSPGLPDSTEVTLSIEDDVGPAAPPASPGDTVRVSVEADFETFVPGVVPALSNISVFSETSMRYE